MACVYYSQLCRLSEKTSNAEKKTLIILLGVLLFGVPVIHIRVFFSKVLQNVDSYFLLLLLRDAHHEVPC